MSVRRRNVRARVERDRRSADSHSRFTRSLEELRLRIMAQILERDLALARLEDDGCPLRAAA